MSTSLSRIFFWKLYYFIECRIYFCEIAKTEHKENRMLTREFGIGFDKKKIKKDQNIGRHGLRQREHSYKRSLLDWEFSHKANNFQYQTLW